MTTVLSQDQLFTYYMYCCGKHHVYKPNKEVLLLLENEIVNNDREIDYTNSTYTNSIWSNSTFVPLAKRKLFKLESSTKSLRKWKTEKINHLNTNETEVETSHSIHVGARGMLALLDLMLALPQLEEIDFSNISSWYVADAFTCHNESISGNDVVEKLCTILPALNKLQKVNISNHPIGTLAADMLYHTIDKCKRLTSIKFDKNGVDRQLIERIEWKLNRKGSEQHLRSVITTTSSSSAVTTSPFSSLVTNAANVQKDLSKSAMTNTKNEQVSDVTLFDYYNINNNINNNNNTIDNGVQTLETENERMEIAPNVLQTILRLPFTDRKTTLDQHTLRALLTHDVNFSVFLTETELEELILHTSVISTNAAAALCNTNGLRGDDKHLFILKDGAIDVCGQLSSYALRRGDYFGDRYDNKLIYPAGQLVERERGHVYCVPLQYCTSLLQEWNNRVRELYYSFVRYIPILQGIDGWSRIRVCTCAEVITFDKRTTVIAAEESYKKSDKDNRRSKKHTLLRSDRSSKHFLASSKGHEKLQEYNSTHLTKLNNCTNASPHGPLPACAMKMFSYTNEVKSSALDTETLYFVQHGLFYATAANDAQKHSHTFTNVLSERKCEALLKLDNNNSKIIEDNNDTNNNDNVKCKKLYTFTSGECFGEEKLISAHKNSSVNIIAEPNAPKSYNEYSNGQEDNANSTINVCRCLKVSGCAVRLMLSQLQPIFRASAACYTQHDDERNNYDIVRAKKAKQTQDNKAMYFIESND